MFQFAFGLATSRRLGTDFQMDTGQLRRVFTLNPAERLLARTVRRVRYQALSRTRRFATCNLETSSEVPAAVQLRLGDYTHYRGYFQSEEYFADFADDVREAFRFRPEIEQEFSRKYGKLVESGYTCAHVRLGDYVDWGVALPWSYYRECVRLLDGGEVVFISDDIAATSEALSDIPGARFESNEGAIDLLLLARAQAVVTSNSSFSWWGAWLGHDNRPVLAPARWFGLDDDSAQPPGILPARWRAVRGAFA